MKITAEKVATLCRETKLALATKKSTNYVFFAEDFSEMYFKREWDVVHIMDLNRRKHLLIGVYSPRDYVSVDDIYQDALETLKQNLIEVVDGTDS